LPSPDDIFFLTLKEIEALVEADTPGAVSKDLPTITANRRLAYDYWFTVVPAEVIGPDGKPMIEEEAGEGEDGLPAVVNVIGATRHIREGQMITVDGTNGRVLLEP
jgi:hypothetical protein